MKTAISLPDDTFRRANDAAAELGVSRSELFVRAVEQYLDQLAGE
jgi:metal-responsive CopG/Arc/MetJ family transcriptional regulator